MRVACINLPWTDGSRRGVRAGSRWPFTSVPEPDGRILYIPFPFYLAHTVSLLKKEGFEARCFDAIAEGINEGEILAQVMAYDPRILVAETSTPSFFSDIRILKKIHDKHPEGAIVLTGPHASVFAKEILRDHPFIAYVALGEYELTILDLARHLENNKKETSIPGLAASDGESVKIHVARPPLDNLDRLPWPERESLPLARYNDGFCGLPVPNVQMWTSRGCPFECTFCLWPQVMYRERKHRTRNVKDVVDEMAYLVRRFSFKAIYFDDDIFNADKNHVLGICAEIKKRKLGVPWAAMARADLMDADMLALMAGAGLYAVKYGVESANGKVLENVKKKMDLDKTRTIIALTKKFGVKVHLTFCLGLPGETRQTVEETMDFIKEVRPDSAQFSLATPFPGTEYFRLAQKEGALLSGSWTDFDGGQKCVIRTKELSGAEIEKLYEDIRCHTHF